MTKEDLAFFVKLLWDSLILPPWGYQDLVDFGKLVYGKIQLKEIPDDKFAKLLPFLSAMSRNLGGQLVVRINETVDPLIRDLADTSSKYNAALLEIEQLKKQIDSQHTSNIPEDQCQTA